MDSCVIGVVEKEAKEDGLDLVKHLASSVGCPCPPLGLAPMTDSGLGRSGVSTGVQERTEDY